MTKRLKTETNSKTNFFLEKLSDKKTENHLFG